MNKDRVAQRFSKAAYSYPQQAVAQQMIVERLDQILAHYTLPDHPSILEIGCGNGLLTQKLIDRYRPQSFVANDIAPIMKERIAHLMQPSYEFIAADAERYDFGADRFDLISSSSTVQWFEHIPSFLARARVSLKANGYIAITCFGVDNLHQIRTLTGYGLHYPSSIDSIIDPELEILHHSQEQIELYFDHPMSVLGHLKQTGVTANNSNHRWTKHTLSEFNRSYIELFTTHKGVSLTYHPHYLILKSKTT